MRSFLPESELTTRNSGSHVVEFVIAHGAPSAIVVDLQTTFTLSLTSDKSQCETGF